MGNIKIDVSKLSAVAFAGLIAGCLRALGLTADVRTENGVDVIVSVWQSSHHHTLLVNKTTKEVFLHNASGNYRISREAIELLFDEKSSVEQVLNGVLYADKLEALLNSAPVRLVR